jgi:outer membrane protein assembly factor BamA
VIHSHPTGLHPDGDEVYESLPRRYDQGMLPPSLFARVISVALVFGAFGAATALAPARAFAVGEEITDIRVLGNQRTEESTVRSIAGISIGNTLEADTLDMIRERLNTAGLFADVNVWWEPSGSGVRVNISVTDKFPWAPVPTGSYSANNWALGLLFVHGNLFGRGKQLLLGGRVATIDSGAALAYRDPSFLGTWMYWQISGSLQRLVIPEFDNSMSLSNPLLLRETRLLSFAFEPAIGIAWFRRVKTQVAWHIEKFQLDDGSFVPGTDMPLQNATAPGVMGFGRAVLSFDFRAREFAVMRGAALSGSVDYGRPGFGSDFNYWRVGASWEHGIKILKRHNFVYFANANAGHNLPFFAESTAGGQNLRGYLVQQFRGDTQVAAKAEYHFPLFSIGSLDFRALGFYDFSAVWFRENPVTIPVTDGMFTYNQRDTRDARTFPTTLTRGFSISDSIHNAVGGGFRFFLRSVAVPLVGFDAGYGIEARNWRFLLIVGA